MVGDIFVIHRILGLFLLLMNKTKEKKLLKSCISLLVVHWLAAKMLDLYVFLLLATRFYLTEQGKFRHPLKIVRNLVQK